MGSQLCRNSFFNADKTGKLQSARKIVNFFADRTQPAGLATVGWDDEGVAAEKWYLVKDGTFVDWQTTRDLAPLINQKKSHGCLHADSWSSVPFPRMPNVSLEPSKDNTTAEDLIGGVDKGLMIHGRGSYSIDQQRYNFQFGGQNIWEIKRQSVTECWRCRLSIQTTDFGTLRRARRASNLSSARHFNDGKGEPVNRMRFSRLSGRAFRNINV